ncbi:hypothetical protein J2TS6_46980 [Paenibacillus albilobatus]|uniref:Uncharacterized protein n=1 Tax=Paenibacillus albilobatus TaxID=2716884 RepID=A0A919XIK0_9BACL|nr:hypothetical protein J2TS6_46980 [Paenibacillus albilobatus]
MVTDAFQQLILLYALCRPSSARISFEVRAEADLPYSPERVFRTKNIVSAYIRFIFLSYRNHALKGGG